MPFQKESVDAGHDACQAFFQLGTSTWQQKVRALQLVVDSPAPETYSSDPTYHLYYRSNNISHYLTVKYIRPTNTFPAIMVKLTEVEDEHYSEKPSTLGDEVLLADDDDDYTDTGMPHLHSVDTSTLPSAFTTLRSVSIAAQQHLQ